MIVAKNGLLHPWLDDVSFDVRYARLFDLGLMMIQKKNKMMK